MENTKQLFLSINVMVQFYLRHFATKLDRVRGNFVDHLIIRVRGGTGGDGAASFARTSRNPKGKPTGGCGGRGGNVVFIPDPSLDSLNHIKKMFGAEKGGNGGANMREGATGKDLIVRVPLGSEIRQLKAIEMEESYSTEQEQLINPIDDPCEQQSNEEFPDSTDLSLMSETNGTRKNSFHKSKIWVEAITSEPLPLITFDSMEAPPAIVARGGRGGKGNYRLGHNNHDCERGQRGDEHLVEIDLKTIADVGLVGIPNAGKSSFLAAISNAQPQIASYPFTTLNPYVGAIQFVDGGCITVADIPGLIEGAHENRGLGHKFLKHVDKATILAFVVDFAQLEPHRDIRVLINELELYRQGLSRKFQLVVANKADLLSVEELCERVTQTKIMLRQYGFDIDIMPISAKYGLAMTKVMERLRTLVQENQEIRVRNKGL